MKTQMAATFIKTIKGFSRTKAVLLGTIAWPIILLAIISFSMLSGFGKDTLPRVIGSVTISMVVFSLMLAGVCNLAGSVARDRENGLLAKLKSMQIKPMTDFSGRILGLLALSVVAVALVVGVGIALGARFSLSTGALAESFGFMLLVVATAAGIGLIIGSFVKNLLGVAFAGIGFTVITSYLSGIFVPYSSLSSALKAFARIYPVSSASSSASYLLLGQDIAGYNPIMTGQVIATAALSVAILCAGVILYSKLSWKRE